jgi:hypothetical protein
MYNLGLIEVGFDLVPLGSLVRCRPAVSQQGKEGRINATGNQGKILPISLQF